MPDVQLTTFATWSDVGSWYEELERSSRAPDTQARAVAAQLTEHAQGSIGEINALYDFTARKIRYVDYGWLGTGGYKPNKAGDTLQRGYGDCKDKVALLSALLEARGLHASSVLVGHRALDAEVPSPWPFTHVIAKVSAADHDFWMDPSSAALPFRLLPAALRGRLGLVIGHDIRPYLTSIPSDPGLPNILTEEIEGSINAQGAVDATVAVTADGDSGSIIRQAFLGATELARASVLQNMIGRSTGEVMHVDVRDVTANPLTFSFDIRNLPFADLSSGAASIHCPVTRTFLVPLVEAADQDHAAGKRFSRSQQSGQLGSQREQICHVKLQVPPTFAVKTPKPISVDTSVGKYRMVYGYKDKTLIVERQLTISQQNPERISDSAYESFISTVVANIKAQLLRIEVSHP